MTSKSPSTPRTSAKTVEDDPATKTNVLNPPIQTRRGQKRKNSDNEQLFYCTRQKCKKYKLLADVRWLFFNNLFDKNSIVTRTAQETEARLRRRGTCVNCYHGKKKCGPREANRACLSCREDLKACLYEDATFIPWLPGYDLSDIVRISSREGDKITDFYLTTDAKSSYDAVQRETSQTSKCYPLIAAKDAAPAPHEYGWVHHSSDNFNNPLLVFPEVESSSSEADKITEAKDESPAILDNFDLMSFPDYIDPSLSTTLDSSFGFNPFNTTFEDVSSVYPGEVATHLPSTNMSSWLGNVFRWTIHLNDSQMLAVMQVLKNHGHKIWVTGQGTLCSSEVIDADCGFYPNEEIAQEIYRLTESYCT